ncbi:MAG: VacB/RNase II family 3'-5' exoribonuclease [Deltaproteobacteria bacterium]|nr:VacB/RNase II family 3'-5' exoribonuclease [Deltaproteobacteria bacterium]
MAKPKARTRIPVKARKPHQRSYASLQHRLKSTRNKSYKDPQLKTGVVKINPDGNGHLRIKPSAKANIFLPAQTLTGISDGDTVTVSIEIGRKGRKYGRVIARGEITNTEIVGLLRQRGKNWYIFPQSELPALQANIPTKFGRIKAGHAVVALVTKLSSSTKSGQATITKVLGHPHDPKVQVEMLIHSFGIPLQFDKTVNHAATCLAKNDPLAILVSEPKRRDLRSIAHITIDGEDARDFDDAVAAQKEATAIRVWVSIADVSHYVTLNSAIDAAARERGTSVYFPHCAIPMLPAALSNEACSLVPQQPRLTLTCEMLVHQNGYCDDITIYPSLIVSSARLTYTEVQHYLNHDQGRKLHPSLPALLTAARYLHKQRRQRGAIDLDIKEPQIKLGPDGIATHVNELIRTEAHQLIEDLMIAANEAVAEYLIKNKCHTIFRVHEKPDLKKITALSSWAATYGIFIDAHKKLALLCEAIKKLPQKDAGMMLLLRSLAQAHYSAENLGHYGLASNAYVHFTSPIRRYPDLLVHRSLYSLWGQHRLNKAKLEKSAVQASEQERRAQDAERKVEQLMACHVAARYIGKEFDAIVTSVHDSGAFVRVNDPWLEGLLAIATLSKTFNDFYDFYNNDNTLIARCSGHRISLGDKIKVQLASVNTSRRHIDFIPAMQKKQNYQGVS